MLKVTIVTGVILLSLIGKATAFEDSDDDDRSSLEDSFREQADAQRGYYGRSYEPGMQGTFRQHRDWQRSQNYRRY